MPRSILARGVAIAFLGASCGASSGSSPESPTQSTLAERDKTATEKAARTVAQRKISSQLLYEIYRLRGEETGVPPRGTIVKKDDKGRALVDVRVEVTPPMEETIGALDGTIVSTSAAYRSIIAWIPLLKLEQLAGYQAVISIIPAPEPFKRR